MKASEAKPLSEEELQTLKSLMERWVLLKYPYFGSGIGLFGAFATYDSIASSTVENMKRTEAEVKKYMAKLGETQS